MTPPGELDLIIVSTPVRFGRAGMALMAIPLALVESVFSYQLWHARPLGAPLVPLIDALFVGYLMFMFFSTLSRLRIDSRCIELTYPFHNKVVDRRGVRRSSVFWLWSWSWVIILIYRNDRLWPVCGNFQALDTSHGSS